MLRRFLALEQPPQIESEELDDNYDDEDNDGDDEGDDEEDGMSYSNSNSNRRGYSAVIDRGARQRSIGRHSHGRVKKDNLRLRRLLDELVNEVGGRCTSRLA